MRQHLQTVPPENAAEVLADHDHIAGVLFPPKLLLTPPNNAVRENAQALTDITVVHSCHATHTTIRAVGAGYE